MHIEDILASGEPTISFEFFPPRSPEAAEKLQAVIRELEVYRPAFVSVTYGAGGTTRDLTHDLVVQLKQATTLDPIPHLTCVGHTEGDIEEILNRYAASNISNLLALRGDLPPQRAESAQPSDSLQKAIDLVRAIRRFNENGRHLDARGFGIGVAGFPEGHPGTPNRLREMDHLKAKVDAGADYICTQLFFDNHDFHDFRARCELAGIRIPILAGLMPVTSMASLHRMAELAGGTRIPARLLRAFQEASGDPERIRSLGIAHAIEQGADLLANKTAGIHFYTLNQSSAVKEICRSLGVGCSGRWKNQHSTPAS